MLSAHRFEYHERMESYQAVIARYEEDVGWARELQMPFIIYNKGESDTGLENDFTVIRRPNVGRESETYLRHIIEQYDALPGHLVLLQGNPFDHCERLLEILAAPPNAGMFVPLAHNSKQETLLGEYNWDGFKECLLDLAQFVGLPSDAVLQYGAGAQFIVPRRAIQSRSKDFYAALLRRVNGERDPLDGWAMERVWRYVFGEGNEQDELVHWGPSSFDARTRERLAAIYRESKLEQPGERDILLCWGDSNFIAHRNLLLQFTGYFQGALVEPRAVAERCGIPVINANV